MDRYAVIGNPVAHSKSPQIHAAFAQASRQAMTYERLLGPLDGFVRTVEAFRDAGGRGLNVTAPFKLEAYALAQAASERAVAAGSCNTLKWTADGWYADNTDGAGIVRDLTVNLGVPVGGSDILVLGAGGAARGVLLPLLARGPRSVTIANRTRPKAVDLAAAFSGHGTVSACAPEELAERTFDVVINATSAGLEQAGALPWPGTIFRAQAFAYDMIYADEPTAFVRFAQAHGARRTADGLGMLVEQAAESFLLWRGVRPATAPVFALLRPTL